MSLTKEDLRQIDNATQNHAEQLNESTFRLSSLESTMAAVNNDLNEIYNRLDKVDKLPKKEADKVRAELKKDVIKVNKNLQFVAKKLGVELTQ